jgi:hypothetical protein
MWMRLGGILVACDGFDDRHQLALKRTVMGSGECRSCSASLSGTFLMVSVTGMA